MLAAENAARYFLQILQKKTAYSTSAFKSEFNMSFQVEKTKFLNMPLAEKRSLYKKNVTLLDDVETWADYWKKHREELLKRLPNDAELVTETVANKVAMWKGDITLLEVDAIVNAANRPLRGGGGVDGAIHKAAGSRLGEECETLRPCEVGEAKISGGYSLPAKYVIHTVGPQGEKPDKLRSCYLNSLLHAKANGVRSIAFPCISTGVYGYPPDAAAHVAISTVKDFIATHADDIDRVIFCVFLPTDEGIYKRLLIKYFTLD